MTIILEAQEHILSLDEGKNRFIQQVGLFSKTFALAVPSLQAMAIKAEVGFFQAVKARLTKFSVADSGKHDIEMETAIKSSIKRWSARGCLIFLTLLALSKLKPLIKICKNLFDS